MYPFLLLDCLKIYCLWGCWWTLFFQTEDCKIYAGDGSVDIKGNPVLKANTGSWRACPFILSMWAAMVLSVCLCFLCHLFPCWIFKLLSGTVCCERLAFYGIGMNLVSYLKKYLHEGNASAATNITTWAGTCFLTPLIGAFLADAYWGRYWTIAAFSTINFIVCIISSCHFIPVVLYQKA